MLENDIRQLIVETLEAAHGANWWDTKVPQGVKDEAKKNRGREEQAAVSPRSDNEIDYITFGQLWDVTGKLGRLRGNYEQPISGRPCAVRPQHAPGHHRALRCARRGRSRPAEAG